MKTFPCQCHNSLFFGSRRCVKCGLPSYRCPHCSHVSTAVGPDGPLMLCGNPACRLAIKPCQNSVLYSACNMAVAATETDMSLCRYCRLNRIIPDLKDNLRLVLWKRIEAAKHRTLAAMENAGFTMASLPSNCSQLAFEIKDDIDGPVTTGHLNGCITIHLKEADSVFREINRVEFGEPQRTLIGHFRHELGHYFWDALVASRHLIHFRSLFGNENDPPYETAKQNYYLNGPQPNWQTRFVSAYASMHPWEDFAETFGLYLDMRCVVTTQIHFVGGQSTESDFDSISSDYRRIGVLANELNRDMGLQDLVPEVFNNTIVEKLRFVHGLRPNHGHP